MKVEKSILQSAESLTPDTPKVGVRPVLRVGVLLEEGPRAAWTVDILDRLVSAEWLDLALVAIDSSTSKRSRRVRSIQRYVDQLLFGGHERGGDEFNRKVKGSQKLEGLATTEFDPAKVESLHLDVLLDLRPHAPSAPLAKHVRQGVWYFKSNVPGEDTSSPEPIKEWYGTQPTPEMKLIELDAQGRRRERYSSTLMADSLSLVRAQITERKTRAPILLRELRGLYESDESRKDSGLPEAREGANAGDAPKTKWWMPRVGARLFAEHIGAPKWVLAYRDLNIEEEQYHVIEGSARQHYADPWVHEREGRHYLFFEAWRDGERGVLCCLELTDNGPTQPRVVLQRPYHLSYPQIVESGGEVYLIPETSQNRTVELYRAVEFPWKWSPATVLLNDVNAVDPTLLQHEGKFWLFASGLGGREVTNHELSLFFADSLSGPWTAHPMNPIVRDVHCARPAGQIFHRDGELIRPGQDSSVHYGYAVSLNRITALSQTEYREVPAAASILPGWLPGILATHTLGRDSRYEVRDAKMLSSRFSRIKAWRFGPSVQKIQLPLAWQR